MGLHQNARLAFVGFAHCFTRVDRLSESGLQIIGLSDARAIAANSAKIGQAFRLRLFKTVQSLSNHLRQRVLARSFCAGDDYRMRKAIARQHLADPRNRLAIAIEVFKRHAGAHLRMVARAAICGKRFSILLRTPASTC